MFPYSVEFKLSLDDLGHQQATAYGSVSEDERVTIRKVLLHLDHRPSLDVTPFLTNSARCFVENLIREEYTTQRDRRELWPEDWHREERA